MVALALPGISMESDDIAKLLHYASKDITNCYSAIAVVIRQENGSEPGQEDRRRRAADLCRRLGRDYQDWLISFGTRHQLMPHGHG
jgi:hypothetical protein